ncbi:MAG: PDZ domain-containing protein [bacterium]|nr:PDZ domain-containing protein [bacterium]
MSIGQAATQTIIHSLLLGMVALVLPARAQSQASVPIHYYGNLPTIDVVINGQGPFRFILDTGATGIVFDVGLPSRLDLEATGTILIGDPNNPEGIEADVFTVAELAIGEVRLRDQEVSALELLRYLGNAPDSPVGIIGVPSLRDYLVTLDLPANRLELARGKLPPQDGRKILDIEIDEHMLCMLPVRIGDHTYHVHLDTGSPMPLALNVEMANELPLAAEPVSAGMAELVSSRHELFEAPLAAEVKLGQFIWQDLTVRLMPHPSDGVIGMPILGDFAITIDYSNNRLKLERGKITPIPQGGQTPVRQVVRQGDSTQRKRYGVRFDPRSSDTMVVLGVDVDSPAARAGLRRDDVITTINGNPLQDLTQGERAAAFRASPIEVGILRDGKQIEITMSLN